MNWKKEGWKVGQEVYLVVKGMFTRDIRYEKGIVKHVGTKLLKVNCEPKMQLTFSDTNITKGNLASFSYTYEVYKSEEDYKKCISKELSRRVTIELIKDELINLSTEDLDKILEIIEKRTFNKIEKEKKNGKKNDRKTDSKSKS